MAKTSKRGILRPYKTYMFRDKDPVIDIMQAMVADAGVKPSAIRDRSGVSTSTLRGWFYGKTRRPQFASVQAVARSLGQTFAAQPAKPKRAAKALTTSTQNGKGIDQ